MAQGGDGGERGLLGPSVAWVSQGRGAGCGRAWQGVPGLPKVLVGSWGHGQGLDCALALRID